MELLSNLVQILSCVPFYVILIAMIAPSSDSTKEAKEYFNQYHELSLQVNKRTLNLVMDDHLAEEAGNVCAVFGITLNKAVILFLDDFIRSKGLSFPVRIMRATEQREVQYRTITFDIGESRKKKATHICDQLGISLENAVKTFLMTMVRQQGIPFKITV